MLLLLFFKIFLGTTIAMFVLILFTIFVKWKSDILTSLIISDHVEGA